MSAIIETTLSNGERQLSVTIHQLSVIVHLCPNTRKRTHTGCKTLIPALDAIAPVTNGKNADPACPDPAIQPMQPERSQGGKIRREWLITSGYMGPRSMPTPDTATAPPTSEGTSQTTISSLLARREGVVFRGGHVHGRQHTGRAGQASTREAYVPDAEGAVEEDGASLADLRMWSADAGSHHQRANDYSRVC